ncbi:MAG TPA: MFS transporter [Terracidiphilus sp.]|jgi:ACS family hexuronate transporter-like MFS transporter|nr:MFS transporter [Terracidiphilus sp.]
MGCVSIAAADASANFQQGISDAQMGMTPAAPSQGSRFRWVVCGLLFAATAINYMDRQVLGILVLPLQKELGWTESQYGLIISGFQAAFALGLVLAGPMIDRVGTRIGYAVSVTVCSVAAVAHGFVRTVTGFGSVRLLLGLGEAGNFPAAVKAIAEWFPARERAFAAGLFNSGSTVGAILAPLVVPWIALNWGWRAAFILIGLLGFLWIPAWLLIYRRPAPVFADEPAPTQRVPMRRLLLHRETWVFLIGRAVTEPVWWFYLYWAPKFLSHSRGFTLRNVGLPLMVMYAMANAGGLYGGWLSSFLLRRGWTVNAARKVAILASVLLVVPVAFDSYASNAWIAIGILGLAMAGHQGWASNLFAMFGDIYPRQAVASVTGLTGMGAAIGGMFAAAITGLILQKTGSYQPILIWASVSYLAVLGGLHLFVPRLHKIEMEI